MHGNVKKNIILHLLYVISWIYLNELKKTWMTLKLLLEYSIFIDCTCSQSLRDLCSVTMATVKVTEICNIVHQALAIFVSERELSCFWLLLWNSNQMVHLAPFLKLEGLILKFEYDVMELGALFEIQATVIITPVLCHFRVQIYR